MIDMKIEENPIQRPVLKVVCPDCGKEIIVDPFQCKACGHQWYSRDGFIPKSCPCCHIRTWDIDKVRKERKKNLVGEISRTAERRTKVIQSPLGQLLQPKQIIYPALVGCSICRETNIYLNEYERNNDKILVCTFCLGVLEGTPIDDECKLWLATRGIRSSFEFDVRYQKGKSIEEWKMFVRNAKKSR